MSSTALGAEKAIIFISDAHEKFYYEKLKEVRYRTCTTKRLYIVLVSVMTQEEISTAFITLRQAV